MKSVATGQNGNIREFLQKKETFTLNIFKVFILFCNNNNNNNKNNK